jgi:hypothetical protein
MALLVVADLVTNLAAETPGALVLAPWELGAPP